MFKFVFAFLFLALPTLAAKPIVVSSFSVIDNFVTELAGDEVEHHSLVGANEDTHVYQVKPSDVLLLKKANLIIINGLFFEEWLSKILNANEITADVEHAALNVTPLMYGLTPDPHAWQDVKNAKIYVDNISRALKHLLPLKRDAIDQRTKAYQKKLDQLDANVRKTVASIPKDNRKIITTHDSLNYYATAYGFDLASPQGWNTEVEPSPRDIKNLISQIKKMSVKAVFLENMTNKKLLEQIAHDTNAKVGGVLYSDALSTADEPASTYIKMIQYNTEQISHAMGGN